MSFLRSQLEVKLVANFSPFNSSDVTARLPLVLNRSKVLPMKNNRKRNKVQNQIFESYYKFLYLPLQGGAAIGISLALVSS